MSQCVFCGRRCSRQTSLTTGVTPALKLFETKRLVAIMDVNPMAPGHALVISKDHGVKLTDLDDETLAEVLPAAKRIAKALGPNYNILQNNGRVANQNVDHFHVHVIPMPPGHGVGTGKKGGLVLERPPCTWPPKILLTPDRGTKESIQEAHAELMAKLDATQAKL